MFNIFMFSLLSHSLPSLPYLSRQMKTYLLVDKGSSDPDITGTLMGRHCQAEQIVHPLEDGERERERDTEQFYTNQPQILSGLCYKSLPFLPQSLAGVTGPVFPAD